MVVPAPQAPSRLIDGDARQPGTELSLLPKAPQGAETFHIRILDDFFRFPVAPQNAARRAEQSPVVSPHDLSERCSACLSGKGNQLGLGRLLQARSRGFSA